MEIKRIYSPESSLVVDLFDRYRVFYGQPSDRVLAGSFIQSRLDNNESVVFVALNDGKEKAVPVGFTQLYPVYSSVRAVKNWILNDLYVDEAFRKHGIGESLIKAAMAFAKETGAGFVELSTATDNHAAQSLYEAVGFKRRPPDNEFYTYRIGLT